MSAHQSSENLGRPPEPGEGPLDAGEKGALLEALASGLEDALPGISVLDRALILDEGVACDLAAVDPAGRLVVVLLAETEPDQATLSVLDLVAWVRENSSVLARHLGSSALRPEQPPRTIVVLTEMVEILRHRLAALGSTGVELFGLRTIQSAAGDRVYLTSISAPGSVPSLVQDAGEAFLGALPEDLRDLGRHAVDRITRLDDELVPLSGQDSIAWRFRGEALVRLERNGDRLRATLGPEHEVRPLRGPEDVEELLEGALSRLVPLFSRPKPKPKEPGFKSRHPSTREALGKPRGYPSPGEPLLTKEELEAFRD